MIRWWAHWRVKDTYTRTSLTSRTPMHTQQKEISPFSATQSLRPWIPFQCYSGAVEKKSSPLALLVWLPNTPGLSSNPCLHSHSNTVQDQLLHTLNKQEIHSFDWEFDSWFVLGPIMAKKTQWESTATHKLKRTHNTQNRGENNSPISTLKQREYTSQTWMDHSQENHEGTHITIPPTTTFTHT